MNPTKESRMADISKFLNRVDEATPNVVTYGTPPAGLVIGGMTGSEWLVILSIFGVIANLIVLSPKIHSTYIYWRDIIKGIGK